MLTQAFARATARAATRVGAAPQVSPSLFRSGKGEPRLPLVPPGYSCLPACLVRVLISHLQARFASTQAGAVPSFASRTALYATTATAVGTMAWYTHLYGVPFLPEASANTAADDGLHPAKYPFEHYGMLETYNHASLRRGYQGEGIR